MHLLFVLEDFSLGGVERVTQFLIEGLSRYKACSLSVICESDKGELAEQYRHLARIYCLNSKLGFRSFKAIYGKLSPDIVIFTKGNLSKYRFVLPQHAKSIAVQHVPIDLPEKSQFQNFIRKTGARLLYQKVDKVVCVSHGIKSNLTESGCILPTQGTVIYNPVLFDKIYQLAQEKVAYKNYFVCVGRLHYQKGYDLMLRALSVNKKHLGQIKIVIIGEGPDKQKLQHQIESEGLSEHVILHGGTSNPYKYIKNSRAILLPSRWEGMPTVLVEAAYLNIPIIAFDCRYGPKELTSNGQNGDLIPLLDLQAFANAVLFFQTAAAKPSPDVADFHKEEASNNYWALFESIL